MPAAAQRRPSGVASQNAAYYCFLSYARDLDEALARALRKALRGLANPWYRPAFAPDQRHLASAGEDGTVRVWECQRCGDIRRVLSLARSRLPHGS